jgi:hypothetical protein
MDRRDRQPLPLAVAPRSRPRRGNAAPGDTAAPVVHSGRVTSDRGNRCRVHLRIGRHHLAGRARVVTADRVSHPVPPTRAGRGARPRRAQAVGRRVGAPHPERAVRRHHELRRRSCRMAGEGRCIRLLHCIRHPCIHHRYRATRATGRVRSRNHLRWVLGVHRRSEQSRYRLHQPRAPPAHRWHLLPRCARPAAAALPRVRRGFRGFTRCSRRCRFPGSTSATART